MRSVHARAHKQFRKHFLSPSHLEHTTCNGASSNRDARRRHKRVDMDGEIGEQRLRTNAIMRAFCRLRELMHVSRALR